LKETLKLTQHFEQAPGMMQYKFESILMRLAQWFRHKKCQPYWIEYGIVRFLCYRMKEFSNSPNKSHLL